MSGLSATEAAALERCAERPMLDQVQSWAALNSGSTTPGGLAQMAAALADAFAALPGELVMREPAPVELLDETGRARPVEHGRNLHLAVRPHAPVQILLTGHMDTVFAAAHPLNLASDGCASIMRAAFCAAAPPSLLTSSLITSTSATPPVSFAPSAIASITASTSAAVSASPAKSILASRLARSLAVATSCALGVAVAVASVAVKTSWTHDWSTSASLTATSSSSSLSLMAMRPARRDES